ISVAAASQKLASRISRTPPNAKTSLARVPWDLRSIDRVPQESLEYLRTECTRDQHRAWCRRDFAPCGAEIRFLAHDTRANRQLPASPLSMRRNKWFGSRFVTPSGLRHPAVLRGCCSASPDRAPLR